MVGLPECLDEKKPALCGRVEWGGLCLIHGDQGGFG
nr:MAG TPA: hypothetical protein [Caudoviricetes sp.]DAN36959.1 MAG TPA: hypothetical protein [Bacteriophage sp.]